VEGFFVGLPGFEPRLTESKSVVLPLHHNPIVIWIAKIRFRGFSAKRFLGLFGNKQKSRCNYYVQRLKKSFIINLTPFPPSPSTL
jgi:hypothetical protein